MTIEALYSIFKLHPFVTTDTRKIKPGDIFFALKGENFNGNTFALQALELGAAYCIVDEPQPIQSEKIILTENVLSTLQALAKYHRQQFNIPIIGITGSNGKTTTKELIHQVMSTTFKTYTTEGNLNNHIGIPLTLLKIGDDAEMAVVEMGANHQKEIEDYCQYVLPTHGLITNCGKAHLEGFGGYEGVLKGKGELFEYLRNNKGTAFLFDDYDYLKSLSNGIEHIFSYGTTNGNIVGEIVSSDKFLEVTVTKGANIDLIKSQLVGAYNLPNILAAICIGKHFGVGDDAIKLSIEEYTPSNSRSQMLTRGTNKIILDAYNANPSSMKAAIENLRQMPGSNKVLILGSMAELGPESEHEHQNIIDLIGKSEWKAVALTGKGFSNIPSWAMHFSNASEVKDWLKRQQFEDTTILIKGSRSMQMEKVLE